MSWSIVLAGGKGERLAHFTARWLGRYIPKQYCAFVGRRTMLEHTLDRACQISSPDEVITVVAREHRHLARRQVRDGIIEQPVNCDTAAGILLPLSYVRRRDPGATVAIFPSDHFIYPEERFLEAVRVALTAAESLAPRLVLLGVVPDTPERDYGWILKGRGLARIDGKPVHSVRSFFEKPTAGVARNLREDGGLWNTMVLAAKVETLWRLGWRHVPELMFRFESLVEAVGTPLESRVLTSIYRDMPKKNFSRDLLERARQEISVIELEDVQWSDWGRAERIEHSLLRLGKRPAWKEPAPWPMALAGGVA
ncbi:MAG TPA: sugar phosphate nucleotidyltransferase [Vicinamibacteria bacterium]|nr:sugar phosphate nucleotidyltransferase [Vicinamibacteria bacterium]